MKAFPASLYLLVVTADNRELWELSLRGSVIYNGQ